MFEIGLIYIEISSVMETFEQSERLVSHPDVSAIGWGKLDPSKFSMDDLEQMHPEDVEEMDITWQMVMAAFRAKHFVRKTRRDKWQDLTFSGLARLPFDKSQMRCYNCHEPGHLASNCTKPLVNRNQTSAQPAPPATRNTKIVITTTNTTTATNGSAPVQHWGFNLIQLLIGTQRSNS
ncbi:putative transcription factor interactor and regulator CCHC(Zn) family [Helianthus anomalus]